MKKLFILSLALLMLMLLSACMGSTPSTPQQTQPETEAGNNIVVLENKASEYVIVRPERSDSTIELNAAKRIRDVFKEKFDTTLSLAIDWVNANRGEQIPTDTKEILIGATNRQESIDAMKELPEKGYIIKTVNQRLVIVGSSDQMLSIAVTHFINEYVSPATDKLILPDSLSISGDDSLFAPKENADGSVTLSPFVFAITYDSSSEYTFIPAFAKVLSDKAAQLGFLAAVNEDATVQTYEILFGECDREQFTIPEHDFLFRDYSINYKDGKISVNAVSMYGYERAMRFLLDNFDKELTIPKDGIFSEYDYGTGAYAELYKNYENPYLSDAWMMNICHRGDVTTNLPENSIPSYQSCLDNMVDIIETDLQRTIDGVWVICHDSTLDRTTNGAGLIPSMTHEQLQKYYLKEKNGGAGAKVTIQKIPTLLEVIELCHGKTIFNLDKVSPDKFQEVYDIFEENNAVDMAMFKSNNFSATQLTEWCCQLMMKNRQLPLFSPLLYGNATEGLKAFRGMTTMVETGRGQNSETLALARENGIGLMCLTALSPELEVDTSIWEQLRQQGYVAVMNDEPIKFKEFVHGS